MMEKLVVIKGAYYEGDADDLRLIHPTPVVSEFLCTSVSLDEGQQAVFREDDFDPVTRIRRGRLYIANRNSCSWFPGRIDHGSYGPYLGPHSRDPVTPNAVYDAWRPDGVAAKQLIGNHVEIGGHEYSTRWRIVGTERISFGHILLTLRAHSLLGAIPMIDGAISGLDGAEVDSSTVERALEALVDAVHRQQPTATVDVARETAKVILTAWIGSAARGKDLADVIKVAPKESTVIAWAGNIVNRFHSRGKSAAVEKLESRGSVLRAVTEDDAYVCADLIGLLLREIGWAVP